MDYLNVQEHAEKLSDDEKIRLAHYLLGQLLISKTNITVKPTLTPSADYNYCLERVLKSRPNRLSALRTFLEAIFSFRGGQEADIDDIIKRLVIKQVIEIDGENITYLVN